MAYYWALLYDPTLLAIVCIAVGTIYYSIRRSFTPFVTPNDDTPTTLSATLDAEVAETLTPWKVLIYPVVGSIVLLALFYFLNILRYLLVAIFAFSSFFSVAYVISRYWSQFLELVPMRISFRRIVLPQRLGLVPTTAVPVTALCSLLLVIVWLVTGNWILSNTIALCLTVTTISALRLPSGMIAVLLLSLFWVYDIFWVFISPLIFPKNVMLTVAQGASQLELPMLIKLPRVTSVIQHAAATQLAIALPNFLSVFSNFQTSLDTFSGFIMLGVGDIALPGLALNYFYTRDKFLEFEEFVETMEECKSRADSSNPSREEVICEMEATGYPEHNADPLPSIDPNGAPPLHADMDSLHSPSQEKKTLLNPLSSAQQLPSIPYPIAPIPWKVSFYMVAQIGYIFGLLLTFFMLVLLKRGQPALLYLVPCTLIPPFLLAWKRNQLLWLWKPFNNPQERAHPAEPQTTTLGEEQDGVELDNMDLEDVHSNSNPTD